MIPPTPRRRYVAPGVLGVPPTAGKSFTTELARANYENEIAALDAVVTAQMERMATAYREMRQAMAAQIKAREAFQMFHLAAPYIWLARLADLHTPPDARP